MNNDLQSIATQLLHQQLRPNHPIWKQLNLIEQLRSMTPFLDNTCPLKQVLWHVANQIFNVQLCCCGKMVKWKRNLHRYNQFCSTKCSNSSDNNKQKRRDTCLVKYGYEYASMHPNVIQTKHNTNLSRYGNIDAAGSTVVRNKINQTLMDRYDVQDTPFNNLNIRQRAYDTIRQQFNGITHKQQHLSLSLLNDEQWLTCQNQQYNLSEIAQHTNASTTTVSRRFKQFNIPVIRHNTTRVQRDIIDLLQQHNCAVVCNDRTIISPHELDIYLPDHKVAIEINGIYWHRQQANRDKHYHLNKLLTALKNNVKLIQIYDHEWVNKPTLVQSMIRSRLQLINNRIYGRRVKCCRISHELRSHFFNMYHIQGDVNSSDQYGLYDNDRLVSVMSFSKPRFAHQYQYEIARFATVFDTIVVGGASKLINTFITENNVTSLVTYSDRRWGEGHGYLAAGMSYVRHTQPGYHYLIVNNATHLMSRNKFQKHKLPKILPNFDPKLTEYQNMINNGYDRVWDCGHNVYHLIRD